MKLIDVAIVGAGFGGICAAIRLREEGVQSLLVLERSDSVGGTWRDNVYPGCACDVPSHMYSFSFEPNKQWTRPYPQQPEILAYIHRVVDTYALTPLIRFGSDVQTMRWLADMERWQVDIAGQESLLARHVVMATGPLNKPSIPDVPGLETFTGPAFHSGHWRHDIELRGKRVAVVGTGASAIQFVPEIVQQAAHVDVFQRTAGWVVPRWDQPFGAVRRWLYGNVPGLQRLSRWRIYWFNEFMGMGFMGSKAVQNIFRTLAKTHLKKQVNSKAMRESLLPKFNPGCKRILISNAWFPALQQPNVRLVTQAVAGIAPQGVVGSDGTVYPCDVIIWGTGFKATEFVTPMRVYGEATNGEASELSAQWRTQAAATRLGLTTVGFPNFFMLVGPNTGLGHNSIIFMIECQVNYIASALRSLKASGKTVLRLKPDVQKADYARMRHKMQRTVWASGCSSWYKNVDGHIDTLWPGYTWQYWLQTRKMQPSDYL